MSRRFLSHTVVHVNEKKFIINSPFINTKQIYFLANNLISGRKFQEVLVEYV